MGQFVSYEEKSIVNLALVVQLSDLLLWHKLIENCSQSDSSDSEAKMSKSIIWIKFFFAIFLLLNFYSATLATSKLADNELANIVATLREEVKLLRQEIEELKKVRDVETDIEEIKEVLESYGKDLTTLRFKYYNTF